MWSAEEDKVLIDCLLTLKVEQKWMADNGFKAGFANALQLMMEQKLPGCGIKATPHITSRIKTLKRLWQMTYDMVYGPNTSGFGWDPDTKFVTAEPVVWEESCEVETRPCGKGSEESQPSDNASGDEPKNSPNRKKQRRDEVRKGKTVVSESFTEEEEGDESDDSGQGSSASKEEDEGDQSDDSGQGSSSLKEEEEGDHTDDSGQGSGASKEEEDDSDRADGASTSCSEGEKVPPSTTEPEGGHTRAPET
ncbi:hypothetical protein K1719_038686 [Acacia pycnantha]|nr:hypothetical protein K1719_038686 [Acacia pycnantha]